MPRLGHKKSRRGCLRCKNRRVKCDEKVPCSACARHGVECVYGDPKTSSKEHDKRSPSVASSDSAIATTIPDVIGNPAATIADDLQHVLSIETTPASAASTATLPDWDASSIPLTCDPFPYLDKFVTVPRLIEEGSWLTDLELMHQYTSTTYLTLPRASEIQYIWQNEIPKLALSHVFLLHQLLAVSAHHQSHLQPERYSHYTICASVHQNKAVAGLRTALAEITEDSCHEVFVASSLLSICAFASLSDFGGINEQPRVGDLLDVFQLVRGMGQILDSYTYLLHQGSLSIMFFQEGNDKPAPLLESVIDQLERMEIPDLAHAQQSVSICRQTIVEVATWIKRAMEMTNHSGLRVSLSFPICLTEQFMELSRQHDSLTLAIIAHYCVILHYAGLENWYLRGWGRSVIRNISNLVDPSCHGLLEWPLMIVDTMSL